MVRARFLGVGLRNLAGVWNRGWHRTRDRSRVSVLYSVQTCSEKGSGLGLIREAIFIMSTSMWKLKLLGKTVEYETSNAS